MDTTEAGRRLDLVLAARFPEVSRSAWKIRIEQGAVLVQGRPATKSLQLRTGWRVALQPGATEPEVLTPDPDLAAALTIIHRDEWLLAVNKPAGVPSHPLRPGETGTVANALAAMDPGCVAIGPKRLEAGLVHRLDVQTSGLLVAARTPAAFLALTGLFREHHARKTYLAIAGGDLSTKTIVDFPIAHHASDPRRMVAIVPGGQAACRGAARPARSEVTVLERLGEMTVLQVVVEQAHMHQIRVHLAALGHPLLADAIYGGAEPAGGWQGGLKRHALHAWKLDAPHPSGQGTLELRAAIPADLIACIRAGGGRFNPDMS